MKRKTEDLKGCQLPVFQIGFMIITPGYVGNSLNKLLIFVLVFIMEICVWGLSIWFFFLS